MVQRGLNYAHRRRGRLDPDRRGAHPAHHLGLGRGVGRAVRQGRPPDPAPQARGRLHRRREGALAPCSPTTASRRWRSCSPSTTCTTPSNIQLVHHVNQALRAHTLYKRNVNYLVEDGKVDHRRRAHRPQDAGPAVERWPAPGDRGQGRRHRRGREPDPRHGHVPELLPHVQEAVGHDRHRGYRGGGVPRDLQAPRRR